MSRKSSRRQDSVYSSLQIMDGDIIQGSDDSLVNEYGDQSQLMGRGNRYVMSPNKMYQQLQTPQVPALRQRGRKSQQLQHSLELENQNFVTVKTENVSPPANIMISDVFGQNTISHLVLPSTHDMVIGHHMEVGADVQNSNDSPNGDVILVTNMLKTGVLEGSEVVVGTNMHAQSVGNEIVIDEQSVRHGMGLGLPTGSGDEVEYDDSELVIDTSEIVQSVAYDCGECGAIMKSRGSLKKHIIKYHTTNLEPEEDIDRIYECPTCPYQTGRRDKLDKHMGKHLAEGYTITGKKRSKGSFPQRMRHPAEEYKCQLCPYKCTVEKALRKHHKLHQSGTKQFVVKVSCYICGKDRSTEADLRKHMKKHRDGKDFQCDVCGFASMQLKKIIQHRRMHTGEKPHLCPHCTYRSSRRDNLRSHVRRMHKKENMYIDTFNPRADYVIE